MTISQLFDQTIGGNGTIDLRLQIEGFDYSFVTNQDMANLSSAPKRINGLLKTGVKISQEVKFPDAKLTLNSNNFTVVDYQEMATKAFYRKPTFTCYLMDDVSTTDTLFTVSNTTGLSNGTYLWIGSECVIVLGIIVGTTNQLIVQRGALGSTPQAHYTLTDNGIPIKPIIQNVPFTIERRRAFLYAYGEGDDYTGDGTLIWRGVVLTQPSFQGTKYTFEVGPITELLKSELGVDSNEIKLRGIYFGAYDWTIAVQKLATADYTYNGGFTIAVNGFYENKYDLAKAIDALLKQAAIDMSWTTVTLGCSVMSNGELVFTQEHTATTYFANIITVSYPVGLYLDPKYRTYFRIQNAEFYKLNPGSINQNSQTTYSNLTANTTYANVIEARYFPTQFTTYTKDQPSSAAQFQISVNPNQDPNTSKRLYFASPLNTFINDILVYDSDGAKVGEVALDRNQIPADVNFYFDNNYIETKLSFSSTKYPLLNIGFIVVDNDFKFTLTSTFGQTTNNQPIANDVIDFLNLLVQETPLNTNNGLTPLITANDIDIADMQQEFDQLSLKAFQTNRKYVFAKKSKKLEDILSEEFKIIGVYPTLTPEGKLTFRRLRNVNPYETPDVVLTSDDILTDINYPTIETNKYGVWNSVVIRNGYNPITEKFDGVSVVQNNVQSISVYGRSKQIEIAPLSTDQYAPQTLTADQIADFEDILYRNTSLFAKDYWVITIDIPIKYFNINIGSVVRIKNKQLPNYASSLARLSTRRGSSRIMGTVVGKNFDLDKGFGQLTILVSDQEYVGTEPNLKTIYAPDIITAGKTNLGSGNWGITFNTDYVFMPSGETHEDFWQVGDLVRFDQFNTTTFDTGYGTIVAVSTGTGNNPSIVVDFSGGVLPTNFSTANYIMKPADFNYVGLQDHQKIYAFVGDGTVDANNVNYPGIFNRVFSF